MIICAATTKIRIVLFFSLHSIELRGKTPEKKIDDLLFIFKIRSHDLVPIKSFLILLCWFSYRDWYHSHSIMHAWNVVNHHYHSPRRVENQRAVAATVLCPLLPLPTFFTNSRRSLTNPSNSSSSINWFPSYMNSIEYIFISFHFRFTLS